MKQTLSFRLRKIGTSSRWDYRIDLQALPLDIFLVPLSVITRAVIDREFKVTRQ
jgi:hypothetical protein